MKIVQINAVIEYSSTGRSTSELHEALKKAGHESWVAAPNAPNGSDSIKIGTKLDQKAHSLYSHLFGRQGFFSKAATRRLVNKLKEIRPDIVHLRNLHANFLNLPILLQYLAESKTPTVITLHDCWPFTGHCCYFVDSNCDRWKSGCGNCPDLNNWNRSWFFDSTSRNLQDKKRLFGALPKLAIIGVSKWVTSFIPQSILKNATMIRSIYNWIDTDLFKPVVGAKQLVSQRLGLNDSPMVICVAQVWNKQKGIYDVVELAKIMPPIKFVLVGNIVDEVALPSNIVPIGVTGNVRELVEYYSAADVFFNPSVRETFGKVTAEALCCGTPVVAYNATATPELVGAGCGAIVNIGDIKGAKRAIEKVLGDSTVRTRCRQFAVDAFCKDKLIRQYLDLYIQLINA